MNAPFDHFYLDAATAESEFALERSRCIDMFARLELEVAHAAIRLEVGLNRDCLGRRVAALSKAKPSPLLSKANVARLAEWVKATERLVSRRASMVHAVMDLGNFAGVWKASFENVFDVAVRQSVSLLVTINDLRIIRAAVENQIDELRTLLKLPKASPAV